MAATTTALTGIINTTIVVKSSQVDAYGLSSNTPVVWTTSNSSVAFVQNIFNTNNAIIYCLSAGVVTITATMGSTTKTFTLTVVSGVASDGYTLDIGTDDSFQPINKTIQTKV